MKKITRLLGVLAAIVAMAILDNCATTTLFTQCETPTLTPPNGSGPAGKKITVRIKTTTVGAYLRWTDNDTTPSSGPTGNGTEIQAASGDATTVYGRTLRAIAYKTGLKDSPVASGDYTISH
jgi:hypothetical protein